MELKYDGTNPVCQGDIYIPAMINNVPVVKINDLAFIKAMSTAEVATSEEDGEDDEAAAGHLPHRGRLRCPAPLERCGAQG